MPRCGLPWKSINQSHTFMVGRQLEVKWIAFYVQAKSLNIFLPTDLLWYNYIYERFHRLGIYKCVLKLKFARVIQPFNLTTERSAGNRSICFWKFVFHCLHNMGGMKTMEINCNCVANIIFSTIFFFHFPFLVFRLPFHLQRAMKIIL